MVSNTQQTKRIRKRRRQAMGRKRKRLFRVQGTPSFPIHQDGYDASAADAKPADKAKASS